MTNSTLTMTTEYYYYYYEYDYVRMTPEVQIPAAIGLSLLILLAIMGNLMAIAAYLSDRKLHTVYDFFIFNLAITDLLLSMISMPFYAIYTLKEFIWPFGTTLCKAWLVVDFTLCFESILLMLILSLDRLLLITLGASYHTKITMKLAALEIALSWLISFMIYSPAIIWWDEWVGYSTVAYMDCDVEFANDVTFTTTTAFVEFVLPFVCLTSLNSLIFLKVRKRLKVRPSAWTSSSQMLSNNSTAGPSNVELKDLGTSSLKFEHVTKPGQQETNFSVQEISSIHTPSTNKSRRTLSIEASKRINGHSSTIKATVGESTARAQREMKAARFLASIVVVFLVLWGPYSITRIMISFCDECINTSVFELFIWILWSKSAINPFIYAYRSVRYRRHFKHYLTCVNCFIFKRPLQQELSQTEESIA